MRLKAVSEEEFKVLLGGVYENYGSQYEFAGRERKVFGGSAQYDLTKKTRLVLDGQWQTTRGVQASPFRAWALHWENRPSQ